MFAARYLLRFDDICPGMNWSIWQAIEPILIQYDVRPILAVVPDNRDPQLNVSPPVSNFWERVRHWQSLGWSIGLHGYQHVYSTGASGILGLNARSEFAGVPRDEQARRLDAAFEIFARERVVADCWVAPGHSFDLVTVELLRERGLKVISDGYFARPVQWHGVTWVPQQLWRFRGVPGGVWTVCMHHNGLSAMGVSKLAAQVRAHAESLTTLRDVTLQPAPTIGVADRLLQGTWRTALRARQVLMARRR